ncbi:type IV toxin-antitoxin system AbiEi family antitoxin domain-containing protein [Microbacterium sp. NPDC019599]|uniref:type IV toxin-antitoxin system AbiEi family antitoxin domain-containing protein n=1 Tax=Microbacterium sp. NPDC019599 TaxID=3154690 RepID=UPI00340316DC
MPQLRLADWISAHSGLAHRSQVLASGYSDHAIRSAVRCGELRRLPRGWVALRDIDPEFEAAASLGGRLTCVTAARRHGLWVPRGDGSSLHVRVPATSSRHDATDVVLHWGAPLAPVARFALVDPTLNVLEAVARCLPFEQARAVWESAIRRGDVSVGFLRLVRWRSVIARQLANAVGSDSDSGLETIFIDRLRPYGLAVRQQVWIDGHPVDVLIGERLAVQIDGFEHHGEVRRRRKDIRDDARLVLLGYTVLRFDYQQVMFDWRHVEASIIGAVAQGRHLVA